MGVQLVEGADLYVEDGFVFMRTTCGPQRRPDLARQQVAKEEPGPTLLLALGEGHEASHLHSARQRFGDRGQQEQIS